LKLASLQSVVLWQLEHWPLKWFAGLSWVWQDWQLLNPVWLKLAGFQAVVLWQFEHCPLK
jgi:hypothetical protein